MSRVRVPEGVPKVGVINGEGPPVPIPNTEVKLTRADNTWLEAARKDRSMPTQKTQSKDCVFFYFFCCDIILKFFITCMEEEV